jgi:hypothetical protein
VCNTVPAAICYHEPLKHLNAWTEIGDIWRDDEYHEFVGLSDHALGFHLGRILDQWAPRTLIVNRSREEIVRSLQDLGVGGEREQISRFIALLAERMAPFVEHPLVRTVSFSSLSDEAIVLGCLDHLMPGCEIDLAKFRETSRLNVQAHLPDVLANLGEYPVAALLGLDVVKALSA